MKECLICGHRGTDSAFCGYAESVYKCPLCGETERIMTVYKTLPEGSDGDVEQLGAPE